MKCPNPLSNRGLRASFHRLWCRECRAHRQVDRAIDLTAARMRAIPVADAPHGLIERLGLEGAPQRPVVSLRLAVAGVCAVAIAAYAVFSHGQRPASDETVAQNQPAVQKNIKNEVKQTPVENTQVASKGGNIPTPNNGNRSNPTHPEKNEILPNVNHKTTNETVVADNDYLNPGRDGAAPAYAGAAPIKKPSVLAMKDDFVQPSPLLLAVNDNGGNLANLADQDKARIQKEINTTDVRLYKAISLGMKHASMTELCAELSRQTGVEIDAGRNVADDNLTIFVTARPARDVMRGISRVFGFIWERTGDDGHFRYTLKQDTTAQIGEEMIRNTDISKALEAIAEKCRRETGKDNERSRAVKRAFRELSASELDTLRSGKSLLLSSRASATGAQTLDPSLAQTLLNNMGGVIKRNGFLLGASPDSQEDYIPFTKLEEPSVTISFRLRITEFGGAVIDAEVGASGKLEDKWGGYAYQEVLGSVPGVAEAPIHNADVNASLKSSNGMKMQVTLKPEPTTPLAQQAEISAIPGQSAIKQDRNVSLNGQQVDMPNLPSDVLLTADLLIANYQFTSGAQPPRPWMTSDDLWEAVHVATNSDVIADSYSRLFAKKDYAGDLFTALSNACDRLQYKWGQGEGFLTGRSTAFHWQRVNEVPKRILLKWQTVRKQKGFLPLESILEMARLSDRQLDAPELGKAIYSQWKLPEWGVLSRPFFARQYFGERIVARFMAALSPAQLNQLQQGTLAVGDVPRELQDMLNYGQWHPLDGIVPEAKLTASYVPPQKFYWRPFFEEGVDPVLNDIIWGNTSEAVQAEVDKRYPDRKRENELAYSIGLLGLHIGGRYPFILGDQRYSIGPRIKN